MQLAAFSLRHLRYLRENKHARVLNISAQRNPNMSLADHADDRRRNPTTTLTAQTVFLCEIMQPCCILSASSALSAGEYSHKSTQSIGKEETPMSPADFADSRRQTPKTTLTTNCLSLRNNAACCIPSA